MSEPFELTPYCPQFRRAIELIGRRWTGAIIRALLTGATRFSDLSTAVPGLSDRLLSERLKELEAAAIVERVVVPSMPVRVEYYLTAKGRGLLHVIEVISAWAHQWGETPEQRPVADDRRRAG